MVKVIQSQNFLDLIFQMQLSLGNKKSFGKWAKAWPVYHNITYFISYLLYFKNRIYIRI